MVGLGVCGTLGEVAWARAVSDGERIALVHVGSASGDPRELAEEIAGAGAIAISPELVRAAPWSSIDASSFSATLALERLLEELLEHRIVLCALARRALGDVRSHRVDGQIVADLSSAESYPAVAIAYAVLAADDAAPSLLASSTRRSRYRPERASHAVGGTPVIRPSRGR